MAKCEEEIEAEIVDKRILNDKGIHKSFPLSFILYVFKWYELEESFHPSSQQRLGKQISRICLGVHLPQNHITLIHNMPYEVHLNMNMFGSRSKHIHVKLHFILQVIEEGDVVVGKVCSRLNLAYMFTKPLQR